jgi:hypothetical protein
MGLFTMYPIECLGKLHSQALYKGTKAVYARYRLQRWAEVQSSFLVEAGQFQRCLPLRTDRRTHSNIIARTVQ